MQILQYTRVSFYDQYLHWIHDHRRMTLMFIINNNLRMRKSTVFSWSTIENIQNKWSDPNAVEVNRWSQCILILIRIACITSDKCFIMQTTLNSKAYNNLHDLTSHVRLNRNHPSILGAFMIQIWWVAIVHVSCFVHKLLAFNWILAWAHFEKNSITSGWKTHFWFETSWKRWSFCIWQWRANCKHFLENETYYSVCGCASPE